MRETSRYLLLSMRDTLFHGGRSSIGGARLWSEWLRVRVPSTTINKTVPICRDCFVLCVFFFMYTWLHRESKERYNKNMSKYVLLIEDDPSPKKRIR